MGEESASTLRMSPSTPMLSIEVVVKSPPPSDVISTLANLPPSPDSRSPSSWSRSRPPMMPLVVSTVASPSVVVLSKVGAHCRHPPCHAQGLPSRLRVLRFRAGSPCRHFRPCLPPVCLRPLGGGRRRSFRAHHPGWQDRRSYQKAQGPQG